MTCCTPWITSGRSGVSASFTMPLRRSSFGPCSERTRSMNISNVAPGIGVSVASVKARMRSSWRFGSWLVMIDGRGRALPA